MKNAILPSMMFGLLISAGFFLIDPDPVKYGDPAYIGWPLPFLIYIWRSGTDLHLDDFHAVPFVLDVLAWTILVSIVSSVSVWVYQNWKGATHHDRKP